MANIYDVEASELIEKISEELKTIPEIKPPAWAPYVKTGVSKERPPIKKDWWYTRAAAILRSIAKIGPIGVSKLRTKYGGKRNRGYRPERFFKGSGNIIRKILQQLEAAGFLAKFDKGFHKGRIITPKGLKLLNTAANKSARTKKKQEEVSVSEGKKEALTKDIERDEKTIEKLDKIEKKKSDKVKKLVKSDVKLVQKESKTDKKKEVHALEKKEKKIEAEIKKEETAVEQIEKEKVKAETDKETKEKELKESTPSKEKNG
jgi:small subunit ribosomal protein S19e